MPSTKDQTLIRNENMEIREQGAAASALPMESESSGTANLEKVREILFGSQARYYDEQLKKLEAVFSQNLTLFRQEVQDRFAAIESTLQREISQVSASIQSENQTRTEMLQDLSNSLKTVSQEIQGQIATLDSRSSQGQRAVHEALTNQKITLQEEIQQTKASVTQEFQRTCQDLNSNKTDRAALAKLLEQVIKGLAENSPSDASVQKTA